MISNIRINQRNFLPLEITDQYFPNLKEKIWASDSINFLAPVDSKVEENYNNTFDQNFQTSANESDCF